jgi:3-phosphoglycerate kinase
VVLGGAKIADKLPVVGSLIGMADQILIGGEWRSRFWPHKVTVSGCRCWKATWTRRAATGTRRHDPV